LDISSLLAWSGMASVQQNPPQQQAEKNEDPRINDLRKAATKLVLNDDVKDKSVGIQNVPAQGLPEEGLPHVIKLHTVPNCRDVGGYNTIYGCKTKMGLAYRSATLDFARNHDAKWIYDTLNTVIDFRDPSERRKALIEVAQQVGKRDEDKTYSAGFTEAIHEAVAKAGAKPDVIKAAQGGSEEKDLPLGEVVNDLDEDTEEEEAAAEKEEEQLPPNCRTVEDLFAPVNWRETLLSTGEKSIFRIPLAARRAMKKFALKNISVKQAANYCFLRWGYRQPDEAQQYLMPMVAKLGLAGFYKLVLDSCGAEIRSVLRIIANPKHHPVLFHCSHGKDRTGLIAALTLSVLGVRREDIIFDYSITASLIPEAYLNQFKRDFHAMTEWAETPAHVMKEVLEYLDLKYGSASAYLSHIGFSQKEQVKMRKIFVGDISEVNHPESQSSSQASLFDDEPDSGSARKERRRDRIRHEIGRMIDSLRKSRSEDVLQGADGDAEPRNVGCEQLHGDRDSEGIDSELEKPQDASRGKLQADGSRKHHFLHRGARHQQGQAST